MPVYCYTNEGEVVERVFPVGKAPNRITQGGRVFRRDLTVEHGGYRQASVGQGYPKVDSGLGCVAKAVPQVESFIDKHKIKGVKVRKDGCMVYNSARSEYDWRKAKGEA